MDNQAFFPELNPLRGAAQSTAMGAAQSESQALTLPGILRDALNQKFASTENPLFKQQETAQKNLLSLPERTRFGLLPQESGYTFSPTQLRSLIAGEQASAMAPLSSANTMIELGYGGINNVVDSATNAFKAQANVDTKKAELARQSYTDALTELTKKKDYEYKERELAIKSQSAAKKLGLKLSSTQQNTLADGMSSIQLANSLLQKIGGGKISTGPIANIKQKIASLREGGLGSDQAQFRADLANLSTNYRRWVSGVAVTKIEQKGLLDLLPKASDQENIVADKLTSLAQIINQRNTNLINTNVASQSGDIEALLQGLVGGGLGDEWELVEP